MDHERFDDLTRALATSTSRRQFLKTLAGGAAGGLLALLGIGEAAADDTCKPNGKKCRKNAQCCSNNCVSGTCAACPSGQRLCNGSCIPQNDCCTNADCASDQICQNGTCVTPCTANGGICGGDGDCCSGNCSNGFCCDPGQVGLSNGSCATPCSSTADCSCSARSSCQQDTSGVRYCLNADAPPTDPCATNGECDQGYYCYNLGVCWPLSTDCN
jgi:hypothetical protein